MLTPEQQQLVEDNINLAHFMARRLRGHSLMEYDDLTATCMEGLCIAAKQFDPNKGFKFSTFAVRVMHSWHEHQARTYVRKYKRETLLEDLGASEGLSWEEWFSGQQRPLEEQIAESMVAEYVLQEIFPALRDREKVIATYLMSEPGITQTEIGERIGVSQVQVSRILCKLRKKIQKQIA